MKVTLILVLALTARTLPSNSSSVFPKEMEERLYQDIRQITGQITGDPDNLDKLILQLRQTSPNFKPHVTDLTIETIKPVEQHESRRESRLAPDSSQPGGNPLVTLQSRINAFFESMNKFFRNFRRLFHVESTEDGEIIISPDPVKTAQRALEEFQKVISKLKVPQHNE